MASHTEEFASLLREFKDRSGLSYGQLASRLHVSTSTLHRYCNGAAVPAEYAPVERLARLCRATPDELTALHRRWLLADAARREPQPPRDPAPAAAPAPAAVAATEPPSSPPAEPDPGRRRQPRRAVLALGAVAAVAAVVTAMLLPLDHGRRAKSPSAAASPSPTPPAPVQVNVLADNWDSQCGEWFLMRHQPSAVPPPPSLEQTAAWAAALGGIPAGHLRLQLTTQARPGQQVVLHALYVHVLDRKPAPKGYSGYTPASGCGGALQPVSLAVDLDANSPRTKPVAGFSDDGNRAPATDFPYLTTTKDPQVLDVDASTGGQDVSWYLELVWSSGDREGRLRVDDHGHPFRTVGLHGSPTYGYDGQAWTPSPPE